MTSKNRLRLQLDSIDTFRTYAKIMQYLEKIGTGMWDFRTLSTSHAQLASALKNIIVYENIDDSNSIHNRYVPQTIWNWR